MARQHPQRCKPCKNRILELLKHIYGDVREEYGLGLAADVEGYRNTEFYDVLRRIHAELQNHRGLKQFVNVSRLPAVDYYIPNPGFVVELDEAQHFTEPREITLRSYPPNLSLGFPKDRWISRCVQLRRRDNDPPYRDEQRAWYDTLRDFGCNVLGIPLIRILPDERVWCELSPTNAAHVAWFKDFIEGRLRLWRGGLDVSEPGGLRIGLAFPELGKHKLDEFMEHLRRHKSKLDMLVFPEAFEMVPRRGRTESEEIVRSPEFAEVCDRYLALSKEYGVSIIVGVSSEDENDYPGDQYCLFVSPTGQRAIYHKHSSSLFNAFFDNNWSIEGNLPVVEVKGVKVGFSVCHDSYISLIPRVLKAKGAQVWVNVSFQNVRPRMWESVLQARASENEMVAVCTLHGNSHPERGDGRPQKEPYAFSQNGKIRLKDLEEHRYIDDIPVTRRTGRIFYFDTSAHETLPVQSEEESWLADKAEVVSVRMGDTGKLEVKDDTRFSVREITIEDFTRFPERIWKACREDREERPNKVPLFVVWVNDEAEWQRHKTTILSVGRGRIMEFSTCFVFVNSETRTPHLAAYRSSSYKDARVFTPAGFPIKLDRRYLKGLNSTYEISLGDSRGRSQSVYFERVKEIITLLEKASEDCHRLPAHSGR
jgi:predicted amidohydrolase